MKEKTSCLFIDKKKQRRASLVFFWAEENYREAF
jgi:hypothetical protein